MLDTLKWKTLQRRRLNMLYKIQNKEVAISTENRLIPESRFTRNMHNLSFQIQIPTVTTESSHSSRTPSGIGTHYNHKCIRRFTYPFKAKVAAMKD